MIHIPNRSWVLTSVLTALVAMGCGGSESPLSPTPSGGTSSAVAGNAIIAGQVIGVSGLAVSAGLTNATPSAIDTLTVNVIGTNVSSIVDRNGRFILNGVPSGTLQLQFTGSGINAMLRLTGVGARDQIQIVVRINGNRVTLETRNSLVEIEGAVSGLAGACPALTFTVRGVLIRTDGSTIFEDGSCAQVRNSTQVEVKAQRQPDGTLLAVKVDAEDDEDDKDDEDDTEFEVKGIVSGLSGTCPSLRFMVNTTTVTTNGSTRFEGGCNRVRNTRRVEVEGVQQAGGVVLARKVQIDD